MSQTTEKTIVALDLGGMEIRAVAAQKVDDRLNILGMECVHTDGIKKGEYVNTTSVGFAVKEALIKLRNRCHLTDEPLSIFTAVGSAGMKIRSCEMSARRDISSKDSVNADILNDMETECRTKFTKRYECYQIICLIPERYEIDDEVVSNPIGRKGSRISAQYRAFYGLAELYERAKGCIDRTGEALEMITAKMEATAAALLTEEDKQAGCCIIDLGCDTTSVGIYYDNMLQFYRIIPYGGSMITSDMLAFLKQVIMMEDADMLTAERFKRKLGNAYMADVKPDKVRLKQDNGEHVFALNEVAEVVESRQREIIRLAIKGAAEHLKHAENGIVLTGGGSKLTGIEKCVADITGLEVFRGSHEAWIGSVQPDCMQIIQPEYSQVVGILTMAAEYWERNSLKEPKQPTIGGRLSRVFRKFVDGTQQTMIDWFDNEG